MNVPEYLRDVLEEAEERLRQEDLTPSDVACRVAEEHDELTCRLQGEDRRDNLEVLKDIRDLNGICADELDPYRAVSPSKGSWGDATIEAITRRSLEDLLCTHLSEEQQDFI